jgi:hypothetical protein
METTSQRLTRHTQDFARRRVASSTVGGNVEQHAHSLSVKIAPGELASMMIDLQLRSEAGEDASWLIAGIASSLARRRKRTRP